MVAHKNTLLVFRQKGYRQAVVKAFSGADSLGQETYGLAFRPAIYNMSQQQRQAEA